MALTPRIRPTRAEIDLGVIVKNTRALKERVGPKVGVFAVVKADAYGHGAVAVARALSAHAPIAALAVSLVEEGIELRRAGVAGPILVMGGVYGGLHREIPALDLTPVISDPVDVAGLGRAGKPIAVHLKLDTGMARLGARPEELDALLAACARQPNLSIAGFCTHLASADTDPELTRMQLAAFLEAVPRVRAAAGGPVVLHVANSAATLGHAEAHLDAVRPGLALYQHAMRLVSAVAQLRTIAPGDPVSYGSLWRATAPSRIATLPVGYADGYPRRLSLPGPAPASVLVRGRRCPVVGAVCMDMTMIDVTALPEIAVGDEAVLLGAQEDERITAAELAARAGLIEYEITCGISKRVPRVCHLHETA